MLILLSIIFVWLQFRLWWGEGSFSENTVLKDEIENLKNNLDEKLKVNLALRKDIDNLKNSTEVLEELARERLGLIQPDEHFFRVLRENPVKKTGNE